ncbi:MAG: metallophosphoesterase [Desulfurococcaceae archaeon]
MLKEIFPGSNVDLHLVVGTPFLYVKQERTLIMADLHLGFEEAASRGLDYSTRRSGGYMAVFLPRIQLKRIISYLNNALSVLNVSRVIVNGDLKHAFDRLLKQEREEIIELADFLEDNGVDEIVVIRGNHDNFVKPLLRKLGIKLINGLILNAGGQKILFIHGHEDIGVDDYDIVVIGHEHPSLRCFELYRFPCIIKTQLINGKKLLVMPASGPYHPGIVVTTRPDEYLSPIIRNKAMLDSMSIVTWFELGEISPSSTAYFENLSTTELVKIEKYMVLNKEFAVLEFKDYETAQIICTT